MSYVASFFPWFPHENLAPFQAFTPDDPHLNALFSNLFPNVFPCLIHLFHPFPRCFPNFSPTLFREDMFFPIFSQFFRCFPSFHPIFPPFPTRNRGSSSRSCVTRGTATLRLRRPCGGWWKARPARPARPRPRRNDSDLVEVSVAMWNYDNVNPGWD